MKILAIILLAATLLGENSYADYTWKGTKDSNFSTVENWDSAPAANSSNQGGLFVANGKRRTTLPIRKAKAQIPRLRANFW